jgi:hypothetical protein
MKDGRGQRNRPRWLNQLGRFCVVDRVRTSIKRVNHFAGNSLMANTYMPLTIDEYLRERLMPVEGVIPRVQGIEMYGNSIPAGTVGGDLFEYINFQQR